MIATTGSVQKRINYHQCVSSSNSSHLTLVADRQLDGSRSQQAVNTRLPVVAVTSAKEDRRFGADHAHRGQTRVVGRGVEVIFDRA